MVKARIVHNFLFIGSWGLNLAHVTEVALVNNSPDEPVEIPWVLLYLAVQLEPSEDCPGGLCTWFDKEDNVGYYLCFEGVYANAIREVFGYTSPSPSSGSGANSNFSK